MQDQGSNGETGRPRAARQSAVVLRVPDGPRPGRATLRPDGRPLRITTLSDTEKNGAAPAAAIVPAAPGKATTARPARPVNPARTAADSTPAYPFFGRLSGQPDGSKSFSLTHVNGVQVGVIGECKLEPWSRDGRIGLRRVKNLSQKALDSKAFRAVIDPIRRLLSGYPDTVSGRATFVKDFLAAGLHSTNGTQADPKSCLGTLLSPDAARLANVPHGTGRGSGRVQTGGASGW